MALKVLGQSAPSATTNTTLYTVPSSTEAVVSTLTVCNCLGTTAQFRVAVHDSAAAVANEHYLFFDVPLNPNDSFVATLGVALQTGQRITVRSTTNGLSFSVFGEEVS